MQDQTQISPNLKDLSGLLLSVGRRSNDQQTVQQVDRNAVRTLVVGASDSVEEEQMKYAV